MTIKESWVIDFADREGCIVYTQEIMLDIVHGRRDPHSFAPGVVTGVEYVIREWFGSWDTDPPTRSYTEIYRATVDLSTIKEWK